MTSLLTNSAAMTALTTLKSINAQLDTTSNRVSTGQRVSAASDNAAYWSIATTVRTDNASLSAVKDSLSLGSSAVDTAYNGLNSVLSDLQNMRAKLQTALQPGVDRAKVQTEIDAIQSKMKATADSSISSGQNWLSVDSSTTNTAYQATQSVVAGFSRDSTGGINFSTIAVDVNGIKLYDVASSTVNTAATEGKVVGAQSLTGTAGFSPGGVIDFATATGGKTKQVDFTITLGTGASLDIVLDKETMASAAKDLSKVTTDEFLSAVNNQIAASSAMKGKVTASLDSAGRLSFQTTATGSGAAAQVSVTSNAVTGGKYAQADVGFGTFTGSLTAGSAYANLDLSSGSKVLTVDDGSGPATVTLDASSYAGLGADQTSASNAAVNGDDVAAMINSQLKAAGSKARVSFDGTNLSFGSNAAGSTTITLDGADVASFGYTAADTATASAGATGKGTAAGTTNAKGILDTVDGSTGFSIGDLGTGSPPTGKTSIDISGLVGTAGDAKLKAIITQVDKAIASVTNAGTKLGANKTQIDGQTTFVDTLMKANDRTIGTLVDADIEEESTKLKALQTQQQLAVQALSIANSGSQNVLSLFR
jgi:flagellin